MKDHPKRNPVTGEPEGEPFSSRIGTDRNTKRKTRKRPPDDLFDRTNARNRITRKRLRPLA